MDKLAAEWIERQPEYSNEWVTFRERAVIERLWAQYQGEAEALRARIRTLEKTCLPLAELAPGDKLLLVYEKKFKRPEEVAQILKLGWAMLDNRQLIILDGNPRMLILRSAADLEAAFTPTGDIEIG